MNADDNTKNGLEALAADIPPPRRTDAAFARSVADGVKQRRASSTSLALPALAAALAAGAIFMIARPGDGASLADAGVSGASMRVAKASAAAADVTIFDDDDGIFAIPALDGSSDEELARFESALDRALEKKL